ncbi:mitochondrial protein Pet127-domain-containing protein [Gaertneriomyces semiglobifer]|nr:mitochondrial protein Pet127-domain-containing protein [Gaertneriomyces semiglobifer]
MTAVGKDAVKLSYQQHVRRYLENSRAGCLQINYVRRHVCLRRTFRQFSTVLPSGNPESNCFFEGAPKPNDLHQKPNSSQRPPLASVLEGLHLQKRDGKQKATAVRKLASGKLQAEPFTFQIVEPADLSRTPTLAHDLDKVLFMKKQVPLRNSTTAEFNFDPWLKSISQPEHFNFDALPPYVIASQDTRLLQNARQNQCRYVSSTSSIGGLLAHIYQVISNRRPVDQGPFSEAFGNEPNAFTAQMRAPLSVVLRHNSGLYAIDAEKIDDANDETIMMKLGKSMEKMVTLLPEEFARYDLRNKTQLPQAKHEDEVFQYTRFENFMLRAQIDCHDPRLPRKTFDLKTRATLPVRMDHLNYLEHLDYRLERTKGLFLSYEREYYDMLRSAFLKYSFQVRIGGMDGLFVSYHNTSELFGFQYISLEEMDQHLFGNSHTGNQAFAMSLKALELILDVISTKHAGKDIRITSELPKLTDDQRLSLYVEPIDEHSDDNTAVTRMDFKCHSTVNGESKEKQFLALRSNGLDDWTVNYEIVELPRGNGRVIQKYKRIREGPSGENGQRNGSRRNAAFLNVIRSNAGLPPIKQGSFAEE